MTPTVAREELQARFFHALLETVLSLKTGPDPEVTLEALIETTASLKEHLEHELEELRVEQVD